MQQSALESSSASSLKPSHSKLQQDRTEEVVAAFKHVFGLLGASREQTQAMTQNLRNRLEDKEGRSKELNRLCEALEPAKYVTYDVTCACCNGEIEVDVPVNAYQ